MTTTDTKEQQYKAFKDISCYTDSGRQHLMRILTNKESNRFYFRTIKENNARPYKSRFFDNYTTSLAVALKFLKEQGATLSKLTIEQPTSTYYIDADILEILAKEGLNLDKCRGISFEQPRTQSPIPQRPQQQQPIIENRTRPSIAELATSFKQMAERI